MSFIDLLTTTPPQGPTETVIITRDEYERRKKQSHSGAGVILFIVAVLSLLGTLHIIGPYS